MSPETSRKPEQEFVVRTLRPLAPVAFALEVERPDRPAFDYRAGQFALVTVTDKDTGATHKKALSFSSSPQDPHMLEFGFERRGFFTQALAKLVPGDTILLRGPLGYFTLPEDTEVPLIMLAGGTGISPLVGILRDVIARNGRNPIRLLYSSRSAADIMFRDELDTMARGQDGWRIQYTITADEPEQGMLRGRMSQEMILSLVEGLTTPLYFLSGPPAMVQDLIKLLTAQGIARDAILTEQYE